MNLKPMYPAANSRYVQLSMDISADQEIIPVTDVSNFPAAPNYAAVETWDDQEVVFYQGIDSENNRLTGCLRGQSDTAAKAWEAGADVLHVITSANVNAMMENIGAVSEVVEDVGDVREELDEIAEELENKAGKSVSVDFVLRADAWEGDGPATQTVQLAQVNDNGVVGVSQTATADEAEELRNALIRITGQTETSLDFAADGDVPDNDIPMNLMNWG